MFESSTHKVLLTLAFTLDLKALIPVSLYTCDAVPRDNAPFEREAALMRSEVSTAPRHTGKHVKRLQSRVITDSHTWLIIKSGLLALATAILPLVGCFAFTAPGAGAKLMKHSCPTTSLKPPQLRTLHPRNRAVAKNPLVIEKRPSETWTRDRARM